MTTKFTVFDSFIWLYFISLFVDRIFFNGLTFQTITCISNQDERNRQVFHESGHFFLAYLMGFPVGNVVVNEFLPTFNIFGDIVGGTTLYYNKKLEEAYETEEAKISNEDIQKIALFFMAGAAAEYLFFNKEIKGANGDIDEFISFYKRCRPKADLDEALLFMRWGLAVSILIMENDKYQPSFLALVKSVRKKKGVGMSIMDLEKEITKGTCS